MSVENKIRVATAMSLGLAGAACEPQPTQTPRLEPTAAIASLCPVPVGGQVPEAIRYGDSSANTGEVTIGYTQIDGVNTSYAVVDPAGEDPARCYRIIEPQPGTPLENPITIPLVDAQNSPQGAIVFAEPSMRVMLLDGTEVTVDQARLPSFFQNGVAVAEPINTPTPLPSPTRIPTEIPATSTPEPTSTPSPILLESIQGVENYTPGTQFELSSGVVVNGVESTIARYGMVLDERNIIVDDEKVSLESPEEMAKIQNFINNFRNEFFNEPINGTQRMFYGGVNGTPKLEKNFSISFPLNSDTKFVYMTASEEDILRMGEVNSNHLIIDSASIFSDQNGQIIVVGEERFYQYYEYESSMNTLYLILAKPDRYSAISNMDSGERILLMGLFQLYRTKKGFNLGERGAIFDSGYYPLTVLFGSEGNYATFRPSWFKDETP